MKMNSQPLDDMASLLRAAASRPGPAGPDCLDEETIAAVVDGAMDPAARSAATRHLASCARCRRAVASVVRGVGDATVIREIAAIDRGEGRRFARFVLPAVAAAALILLLVRPRAADDDISGHRGPPIGAAVAPVPLAPVAAVAGAEALRWTAVPGADRYRVTLYDAGGRVLYATQLGDTVVALPDSIVLAPGESYLWNVEARIGWDRWSSSALAEFSIVGPARR